MKEEKNRKKKVSSDYREEEVEAKKQKSRR